MQHINIFTKTRWLVTIILLTTLCIGNVWGADNTVTWTATSGALGTVGATSTKNQTGSISTGSYSWNYTRTLKSGTQYAPSWVGGTSNFIQLGKNGCVENIEFTTSAIPGTIKTVSIICSSYGASHKVNISVGGTSYVSNANTPSGQNVSEVKNTTTGTSSGSITISITGGSRYVCIKSISVKYNNDAPVASCTATPSIGAASLNGSFSLSSVGVSCVSSGAGANCSITKYGWVWSDGTSSTDPVIDGTGVTKHETSGAPGTGGAFTGTLSGSFTVGHTYYYKAYVTNGKPATEYSTVQSFTPYTVTFNMKDHGTAPTQQVVNTGGKASQPTAPSATGWTFGGWYTDENCTAGNEWNFSTGTVTSSNTTSGNLNLYAKWTIKSHTLTWDFNGGTCSATAGTDYTAGGSVNYGATITKPAANTMSKTGYNFSSWSSSATTMPDADLTISANWTAQSYIITYYDGDAEDAAKAFSGTHASGYPTQHTYGTATTLKGATKTGYDFGGWFANKECTGDAVTSLSATGYTAAITLYAKWTVQSYTLTWSTDGDALEGDYTGKSGKVDYGTTIVAPNTPTKYGYTFKAWSPSVAETMPAANTTYTATWTAKSFTVTWKVNGEVYSAGGSANVNFDSHVNALPTAPTPPCGDKFMGWTTDEEFVLGTSPLFTTAAGAPVVSVEGNVTYHAVFADYAE